jgi:hypothetical protein
MYACMHAYARTFSRPGKLVRDRARSEAWIASWYICMPYVAAGVRGRRQAGADLLRSVQLRTDGSDNSRLVGGCWYPKYLGHEQWRQ